MNCILCKLHLNKAVLKNRKHGNVAKNQNVAKHNRLSFQSWKVTEPRLRIEGVYDDFAWGCPHIHSYSPANSLYLNLVGGSNNVYNVYVCMLTLFACIYKLQ